MKKNLVAVMVGMVMSLGALQAHAEGCLKGAAVGAVAGHFVGRGHAVLGAVGGCMVGRHMAKKKHEQELAAQAQYNQNRGY